jgi:hypothetical protein
LKLFTIHLHYEVRPSILRVPVYQQLHSEILNLWYSVVFERPQPGRYLVVRVPGYRPRGPGSLPGATRFSFSTCGADNNIYPTLKYRLTYQISAAYNLSVHIFQVNSFTAPGTGPTGNIYHVQPESGYWNLWPISTKRGRSNTPLNVIVFNSL